jgi:hypothetical protein
MIIEKKIEKDTDLGIPKELIEQAQLHGRVVISIEKNSIIITKARTTDDYVEDMVGLGKDIFGKKRNSVDMVKELRGEWKL